MHAALHLYPISSFPWPEATSRHYIASLKPRTEISREGSRARINFSPSSLRGDPGGDQPIRNVFRWSICRDARTFSVHFPHLSTLFFLSLTFSQYSQTSYRTSKISNCLRSDCRSRLIVTVATLDRFSNFDMTLKKWLPSRDDCRKCIHAHARERGTNILNWYRMLTWYLDWLSITCHSSYDTLVTIRDRAALIFFSLSEQVINCG